MSLVCVDELGLLQDIEKLLGERLQQIVLKGYEPDRSIKAEPLQQGRGNRPSHNRNRKPSKQRASKPAKPRCRRRAS